MNRSTIYRAAINDGDAGGGGAVRQPGRRRFLQSAVLGGAATAAALAMTPAAEAQTAKEEARRKKNAKYSLTFATAYALGASRAYPVMQLDFKENVQNFSGGEIYVNLAANKKLGAGKKLANKVQQGVIQVAQHSISNFAPFAPAADVINIPFWCAQNQQFVNLVTSDAWRDLVNSRIEEKGFKALLYVSISARTYSVRRGQPPILSPADMRGVKFRVPGSKMLQQFYRLLGANPTPVAWGETPSAIKQGVADALDPVVSALHITGFADILSHITLAQSVHGAQVYSCNLEWFKSLPPHLQDAVEEASDVTFRQNLAKVPAAFAFASAEMRDAGVQMHTLTEGAMEEFVALGGHQRDEWKPFKESTVGSAAAFEKMLQAANTLNARYAVTNV